VRLDFNVLWIDDQPASVDAQIKRLSRQMEDEGFLFSPTLIASVEEVSRYVADDVFSDQIDLILVDWDLGENIQGQDAIAAVRQKVRYKEVVFYSARNPANVLRELAFKNGIEGIFCTTREDLVDDVIGVFDALVKKVLDLDHSRGIVMGATSDIDHIVNECLRCVHSALDDTAQKQMVKEMIKLVQERFAELSQVVDALDAKGTVEALLEAHLVFTAYDRLRVLTRALKMPAFAPHKTFRPAVTDYMDKVVPGRNNLGHVVLIPKGKPTAIINVSGKTISLEETRELRRLILRLRSDFLTLLDALRLMRPAVSDSK
jgi:hypothetical protein